MSRKSELAAIHVGKKALGLKENDYRAILARVTGKQSAAHLNRGQRIMVIEYMRKIGFKPLDREKPRPKGAADRGPMHRKIAALLRDGGYPDSYADGIAKKMFGIDSVKFCQPDQLRKIIAALTYNQRRQARKEAHV